MKNVKHLTDTDVSSNNRMILYHETSQKKQNLKTKRKIFTWWDEHRDNNSHSTNPQAYISIRRNESREKFIAPSKISGAIYRRVPT